MNYYRSVIDGYISAIVSLDTENHRYAVESIEDGLDLYEITEAEYENLLSAMRSKPYQNGYLARLKADTMEWELVELPQMPEPELTDEEAIAILLGGDGT